MSESHLNTPDNTVTTRSFIDMAMDLVRQTETSLQSLMIDLLAARAYNDIGTVAAITNAVAAITPESVRTQAPPRQPRRRRAPHATGGPVAPPVEAPVPPDAASVAPAASPVESETIADAAPVELHVDLPTPPPDDTPADAPVEVTTSPVEEVQAYAEHPVSEEGEAPLTEPVEDQAPPAGLHADDDAPHRQSDIGEWPSTAEPPAQDFVPPETTPGQEVPSWMSPRRVT